MAGDDNGIDGPDVSVVRDFEEMSTEEVGAFNQLILPDDIYTPEGVYWADLPLGQRIKFVTNVDGQEARKELRSIWEMTKRDPLSPVSYYFKNMVLPGAGLGLEGCVLELSPLHPTERRRIEMRELQYSYRVG